MNKKELLRKCWISVEKRMPPRSDGTIVVWGERTAKPIVMIAVVACEIIEQQRINQQKAETDYFFDPTGVDWITHWMELPFPEGLYGADF